MIHRFGPFAFDSRTRELLQDGVPVALPSRPARVLAVLLEHHGALVTKDELVEAAWDGMFVTDDAVFRAVAGLRQALGDDARNPRYVRTEHGRGYRFVAEVATEEAPGPPGEGEPAGDAGASGPVRRAGTRVRWATSAAMVSLILALLGVVLVGTSRTGGDGARLHELLGRPRGLSKPAWSPGGELLAAVGPDRRAGTLALFLVTPGSGQVVQLTHGLEVRGAAPVFSPDGGRILFTVYGSGNDAPAVFEVPVLGGRPRPFLRAASAVTFDPGGGRLAYAAVTEAGTEVRVRARDGSERVLARPAYWPRWSPDGGWIAWTTSDPEGGDGLLYVARPDGSDRRRLSSRPAQHYGLCWTADSRAVVVASNRDGTFDLWRYPIDRSPPVPLTVGAGNATCPAVHPDGDRVVFARGSLEYGAAVLDDPEDVPDWIVHQDRIVQAAAGPGEAVAVLAERPGRRVLRLYRPGAEDPVDLGSGPLESIAPAGAGTLLVTVRDGAGTRIELWGPGPGDRTAVLADQEHLAWAVPVPDERGVVAVRRLPDGDRLVAIAPGEGERVLARSARIVAPRISPEGRVVAFSGGYRPPSSGAAGVWLVPLDGSAPPRRLTADGAWPCWADGGRALVFVRYFEREGLWRVPASGGEPVRLRGPVEGLPIWHLDRFGSGRLLVVLEVHQPTLWTLESPRL